MNTATPVYPPDPVPFLSTPEMDVFLLPVDQDDRWLAHCVRHGTLTSYRYVDAKPHPAILAIRSRT